jgi:hypothetical protein
MHVATAFTQPTLEGFMSSIFGSVRPFSTAVLAATLAACGGGDDDTAVAPPPAETASGLAAATGTLTVTQDTAQALVTSLRHAIVHAPGGIASKTMGAFTPGVDHGLAETFDCPDGGTASFQPTGVDTGTYTYDACVIEGVSFVGASDVSVLREGGELRGYTMAQSGITATVDGTVHALDGRVECVAVDDGLGAGRESPLHIVGELLCVGHYGGTAYGADFHKTGATVRGSMQWPRHAERWNAYAWDVDADSGSAYVAAGTGIATIRDIGDAGYAVTISADGQSDVFRVAR